MSTVQRNIDIYRTRLQSLSAMLGRAEVELATDSEKQKALLTARLAPDMLPLPNQIWFTCRQPELLLSKLSGTPVKEVEVEALAFTGLQALVKTTLANLDATEPSETFAESKTTLEIPGFPPVKISGADYLDEWLMPNFYFHFVTAYDILRAEGLALGKADYMSHIRPLLAAGAQAG